LARRRRNGERNFLELFVNHFFMMTPVEYTTIFAIIFGALWRAGRYLIRCRKKKHGKGSSKGSSKDKSRS